MSLQDPQTLGPLIGIAVAAVFVGVRMARGTKARRLRIEYLWITPLLLVLVMGLMLWEQRPDGLEWAGVGVALALGAALGWQRGRLMAISVDPETNELNQRASPAALLLILVLVVVRIGARTAMEGDAAIVRLSPVLLADVFLAFAVGLVAVTRLEMFLRARRLLAAAKAA